MAQDPNEKWLKEQTSIFIEIYKKYPSLYDAKHPDYLRRTTRSDVMQEIERQMQDVRPGITCKEIHAKIRTLSSQVSRELKEKQKFNETDLSYKPKLWCFDQLQFLANTVQRRTSNGIPKKGGQKTRRKARKSAAASPTNSSADDSILENDADEITIAEMIENEQANCSQNEEANYTQTEVTVYTPIVNTNSAKIEEVNCAQTIQETNLKQEECKTLWYQNEALKALKLATIYVEKNRVQSKEEKFCDFLATQMKCFKNDDDFLNATYQIMEVVWKLKSNQMQTPAQQAPSSSNVNLKWNPISPQIKCPPDEDIIDVPSSSSEFT